MRVGEKEGNGCKRRKWVQKNRKGGKSIEREPKKRMGVIKENRSKEESGGKNREMDVKEESWAEQEMGAKEKDKAKEENVGKTREWGPKKRTRAKEQNGVKGFGTP